MNIRQATVEDASDLQKINDEYFGETRNYKKEIESKDTLIFLCEDKNKIVGISGLKKYVWNNTAWILNIFILPEMRRKGIAKQLILHIVEERHRAEMHPFYLQHVNLENAATMIAIIQMTEVRLPNFIHLIYSLF